MHTFNGQLGSNNHHHHHQSQYIKILVVRVCVCVTDVGVAVTNLRVVCKIIRCGPPVTEMATNVSRAIY